jgi:hypothetical protein
MFHPLISLPPRFSIDHAREEKQETGQEVSKGRGRVNYSLEFPKRGKTVPNIILALMHKARRKIAGCTVTRKR